MQYEKTVGDGSEVESATDMPKAFLSCLDPLPLVRISDSL